MFPPLLSLLVYITTISSQARSEELFASDTVSYDGRDFTFHEQRLTWSEAASLCRSMGGGLAIVNSMAVAKFLVDSQATLPQQREYEDVWIGGRYKNGKWIWKSTGEVFPSTTGEDGFPPWVNQGKNKHNCLLLNHYEFTLPMFVDQECGSLRSFVCEKAQEVKLTTTQLFEDSGHRYYVYKGPVSWDRAVAVCRDNGSYLALVNDLKEAKFLATAFMSSSFNVRFAWLGGRLEEGSWEWLKTGDTIPSEVRSDGFPPWEYGHAPLFGSECLILDRADGRKPNFVSSNCTSLQSFVCEEEPGKSVTKQIFKFHGYEFLLFSQKMTWDSAVDACRIENAQLAAIEDMTTARFIAMSMAKSWESLHMIWLGARQQQNHKWKWLITGDELVSSPEDHTGYPPWRMPATQRGVDCLTMERAVHDTVYFLQRRCEISQAFLCQRDLTTAEPVVTSLVIGDRNFTIHEKPETWERALDVCKSENSHLAVLQDNEEVQVLNNVSDIRRLWLGGHWIADKWMWIQIGETIPDIPDEEGFPNWSKNPRPKPNYDCLQLDLRKVTNPKLAGHTCGNTLGYLCEKIMKTEDVHEYQGLSYVVYNKRVTWEEAATFCRAKGYYLAIASDLREAQFLAHLTQEYYELWLGGVARNGTWEWEHTGENIPSIPQRNDYPPWVEEPTVADHNCLSINRAAEGQPVFVKTQCDMTQSFVCEKGGGKLNQMVDPVSFEHNERVFTFHPQSLPWLEALEDCQENGGSLAMLEDLNTTRFIAELSPYSPDLWVGAEKIKDKNKWHWISSEEQVLPRQEGEEYPPWARPYSRPNHDCLAVNKHNPDQPIFVDLLCNESHPYVCEKADYSTEPLIETVPLADRELIFIETKANFTAAEDICDGYNGMLAILNTPDLLSVGTKHAAKYRDVWIGAVVDSEGVIRWKHTGQEVPLMSTRAITIWEEEREIYITHDEYRIILKRIGTKSGILENNKQDVSKMSTPRSKRHKFGQHLYHEDDGYTGYPYSLEDDSDDLSFSPNKFQNPYSIHTSQNYFTGYGSVTEPFSDEQTSAPFQTTYVLKQKEKSKRVKQKANTMEEKVLDEEWDKESAAREKDISQSTLRESTLLEGQMTSQKWDIENTMGWKTNSEQETTLMDGRMMQYQRTPQIENWDDSHTGETTPQGTTSIKRKTSQQLQQRNGRKKIQVNGEQPLRRMWNHKKKQVQQESGFKRLQRTKSQETETEGSSTDIYVSNSWTDSEDYNIHGLIEQQKKQKEDMEYSDSKPNLGTATVENDSTTTSPSLKQNKTRCLKLGLNGFVVVPCHTKHSILCERRTNSSEPVVRTYQYNGRSYGVSSQKVTWQEANNICQTNNSYLAVLTNAAETNFLANISSEFQDLWIGARVIDGDWEWEHTGQKLPGTMGKNGFPPWANSPARPGYNCLNLYRQGPGEVLFVDRKCHEEHGFICEDVNTGDTMNGKPSPNQLEEAYQFDERIFVFNNKLLDWDGAAEYCVSYEGVLAAFKSMDELRMLENINPSFHDLWVGGHVRKSEWFWEQYHEKILGVSVDTDVPDESSISLKPRQSVEPAVWVNNYTRPGYNCASVYRETDNEAFLMAAECNTRHGFVCELISDQTLHFRGRQYTFHVKRLNWTQAKEFCASRGQYLSVVDDFEEAAFLADVGKVFRTMWIGARYKVESPRGWMWDHTGEAISSHLGRFQTWIKSHQTQHSSNRCLSLFHAENSSEIFINSSCNQNLTFVCEETDVDKLPRSVQVFFNQRPYTFYSDMLTWKEAVEACRANGSYLAVVNDAEEAEFIAGNNYGFHNVWVGGHKEAGRWEWVHTGQYLPPVPSRPDFPRWSVYPQRHHKDCTSLYRNTNGNYMFIDRYCEERRSYVCEESGDLTETHSQTYIFKDSHYTFYTKAATWHEATDMCLSSGKYLAIVDTPEVANFIALNVSRAFHDLWVDGHLEDDHWMWARVGREIPTVQQNAGEVFPPWIHVPSRPGHKCLNLYRPDNTEVQFLDRKCDEQFSFICEYGTGSEKKVQSFEFNGRTYTFYSDKVDWNKANSICRSNGTYLAIVSSKNEADFLVKVGEEFLNFWVGAQQINGIYVWNHTGEIFSTKPGPDGFPEPFTKNAYITDACINVGRVAGRAVFVDRQCEALHSFVCEDSGDKGETHQMTYKYNNQLYTVSSSKVSWDQASEYCADNGSYLAIINSKKEFEFLSKIAPHFHDLWLGAREYGGMWKWEYTGESLVDSDDSKKSSNNSKINKFKPAWVESYWEDDGEKCLNVYRRNLTESLFIGQPCNRTFGFVCESSPIGSEPKTMVVTHKGRKYALHNRLVTWTEAVASCRASGSYLAVITDLEEAWSIAAANITFHDLWLGGHLREYHWEWENTGQPLDFSPNVSTGYPPWIRVPQQPQHNCINLYSDSGRPYFVDRRCRELHGYVCEEAGSDENTSIVEYFGGHRYVFVNKHVTWSTAVESCRAMQGYLAVASDNDELRFIVNGTRDFHDVWIGGHMSNSHWEWDHTGQKLLTPSASPVTGSDIVNKLVPQWIRFPTRPVHDCLSVYRDNNNSAYLLDSRCNSQHTYVCEDVPVNQHKEMEIKQYKHRNYILVYERASWDEAVRVCHARGGYLAVPDDLEEARFLVSASADLHDVWVGGARKQYHPWEWTHTGRLIGAIIPWASQPRPAHDCVNLYRDRGSKPLLVARRCAQRFGFICEDTTDDDPVSQVIRFRGRNYFFSNQAETWETAVNICKSRGSYLAIVGDIDEADFIATVSPYFHDVWVGGSSVNGLWKWEHTGQTIPNKRPTKPLGKDGYPPWIGNTTRPGHDCLNVYRGADDTPSFIDRLCDEKHAYVCEEAPDTKNAESLQEFNGRIYKFYSRRVTWDHALEICKESGSYLAVVTEPDEAVFIARSGKDFHDLWVGGKLDYEKWEWDHTGQSISPHNSDPSVFPWWSREIPVVNNECLNIYRDDDSKPLFVDRHCSELKGFVCEEAADTPSENQVLELNGNMYIFTPNKMIWSDAYDACMNNGSTLPVVLDSQTAIFLASAWSEYHNIWLSGYLEDTHWVWKPKERRIPTVPGDDGFPAWVRSMPRPEHDCLSLYRDTENKPFFLDTRCEEKRLVVCQKFNNNLGEFLETFMHDDRRFIFVHHPETWSDASEICRRNGSFLAIIYDHATSRAVAKHIGSVPDIWTGGRLQEHRWFWELSGEEVLSMKDDEEFPIWIGEPHDPQFGCMALDSQVAGQPRFADRDCSIPKPFVCESGCLPLTQARRGQWSRSECLSRVGMRDEVCELSCYEGFELWGSRRLVCSKSGWNGTKPQCVTPDKLAYEFVERLNATLDAVVERLQSDQLLGTGILFVIGKTTTLGHAGYDQITEFLKATVAAVRLSPSQVSAGVITYGPEVVLEIPLNTSDTCDFIDQADQMLYDHSGDNVDLQEALSHAKEHIEKTGLYERTVIVLITDADSTEDSTEVITELKSLGHKFFAIGIGTSVSIENLEAIASKPISPVETTPNFYLLSSLHTFGNMVSYLNETYLYNSDLDCCMLLHVPAHGQWEPAQCSERPGNLHDTCSILCEEGYELVGDLKLTCTEHGWYGENGKGHIPSCHSVVMVTRSMFDRMDETLAPLDNVGILFLVDQSTSMSILDFQEQTAFVKMIVNKFSLSKTRTAGLITFNTKASVKVPLNTSDTCSFLVTLDQLSFQGGGTSFSAALQAAEEEISLHGENSTIVLFLMTDGRSYGNPKVVADRLKADGHIIFTLGVGGYNRRQLEALASVGPNQRPQFFSLADFEALKTAVSYINSTLMRSSEKHCCLKLDPDVSGVWDPPNCAVAPSEEHDVCYLTCDPGYELFGSDQLSCSADGWGATMPTCFAKPDLMGSIILYQLKDLLELKEESASIVFLVDHTDTLNHESFDMLTEFIKLLASRFSLSSELTAGMIVSYKYGNDIEIPFNTNNTCTFLSNLDKIRREKGSPSLSRALRLIRKLSDSPYDEEQNMIIVLLTDRQAITKPSVSLAKKLKNSGNSILVIGINNRVVYNDLFKIASGEKQPNNMVIIDTYDTLESVTDYLTDGEKQLAWYSDTGYSAPDC